MKRERGYFTVFQRGFHESGTALGHHGSMDTKASLWTEYRHSFAEFSEKVRRLQSLTGRVNPDPEALATASYELEQARVLYLGRREALVEELMRPKGHSTMWRSHSAMASSACC